MEQISDDWDWLDDIAGAFSEDFLASGREQPELPSGPDFDHLAELYSAKLIPTRVSRC